MSNRIKFTKEQESFIQQWTALHHPKAGEFYYIPYYFKKIKPADPLIKSEVLWEIVSHDNLPDEIKEMILEIRKEEIERKKIHNPAYDSWDVFESLYSCKHKNQTFNSDAGCFICDDCNEKI